MNRIKALGIIAILTALVGVQIYAAQQQNDYRAYMYDMKLQEGQTTDGSNVTVNFAVAYVPIYPSSTYTFTSKRVYAVVDMSNPTKVNDQIATAIKNEGLPNYNVIRVFVPSYEQKIP